jgi:hypothetical protein
LAARSSTMSSLPFVSVIACLEIRALAASQVTERRVPAWARYISRV